MQTNGDKVSDSLKSEDDSEGIILDITDGDGNWKGAATNVTL